LDRDTGEDARAHVPFRARRGGTILGGHTPMTLRGVLLRPQRWTFASQGGDGRSMPRQWIPVVSEP
jgi:hypothetical protein